jgi:hypothetical protein
MRAAGYRLNPTSGVNLPAATYGSGNFGTQTYGQAATDPVAALRYVAVFDGGYPVSPGVRIQAGDQQPTITAVLVADDGGVLDLTAVSGATLTLDLIDGRDPTNRQITLTATTIDTVNRVLKFAIGPPLAPLVAVGVYRAVVRVTYNSGRRLSAPAGHSSIMVISDGAGTGALVAV